MTAMNFQQIKKELAQVFDDNLRTRQWQNIVDYVIIGLIVVSTVEVFLSTYENIVEKYGRILKFVDWFTTIFFTIEVTLRIWTADLQDSRFKGFKGRLRYCFTFYGLIDILSTYPFYLHFFMPMPYAALKILRVFRLLRIFRYMKSFRILGDAISSKKQELTVSLAFLSILTVILSFLLYFAEHAAQPELCENGWKTMVWAFAKYLGDPGKIADFPMVTFWGNLIAIIVGVLGIAIFAVPAGLISSGFIEVMEERRKTAETKKNVEKMHLAFERKLDRPTGFQIVPAFVSIADVQSRLKMSENDIFDALANADDFRLVNLAATRPADQHPEDRLVIEHYQVNRPYGVCIDRGSTVTIVSPSSLVDPIMGYFSYYLAKIGGFNYMSRDVGEIRPYKSFYLINKTDQPPFLKEYLEDMNHFASVEGSWIITLLAASGANEPEYPTQFHFTYGGKKGDETYNGENLTIHDVETFDSLYKDLSSRLEKEFGYISDCQRYHDSANPKLFVRHLEHPEKTNALMLRIAWKATCWDMRRIQIAKALSDTFAAHLLGEIKPYPEELSRKGIGYSDYSE
jgi:voltage-gated potassium channel